MSVVSDVTQNAVCIRESAVYQGIFDTISKLAKRGDVKKKPLIKHLSLWPLQDEGLKIEGISRTEPIIAWFSH